MKRIGKIFKWTLFLLLCIEIVLHFYNPWKSGGAKKNITLSPNARYELKDIHIPGLDQNVVHTKNGMGFRGEDLNKDKTKRIFVLGGSTTECYYLNDSKDWPSVLSSKLKDKDSTLWLNNAGLEGQSSSDNLTLIERTILPLNPAYIILMCGLNDIGLNTPDQYRDDDNWMMKAWNLLELPKAIRQILNGKKNVDEQSGVSHQYLDLNKAETLEMNDSQILQRIAMEQPLLVTYQKRLQTIADICKENKIKLILVSQAILFGDEKDVVSNVDLGTIKTGDINGKTEALLLKQYNKTTFDVAQKNNLPFINLSATLPKDSRYFYDGYNFTNEGAEMVADKIFFEVKDLIKK